jgi:hypothetical protein
MELHLVERRSEAKDRIEGGRFLRSFCAEQKRKSVSSRGGQKSAGTRTKSDDDDSGQNFCGTRCDGRWEQDLAAMHARFQELEMTPKNQSDLPQQRLDRSVRRTCTTVSARRLSFERKSVGS